MNLEINKNIKKLIENLGTTPYEFSKSIGNDRPQNIYNIVNEKVEVSATTLNKIFKKYPDYKDFVLNGNIDIITVPNSIEKIRKIYNDCIDLGAEIVQIDPEVKFLPDFKYGKSKFEQVKFALKDTDLFDRFVFACGALFLYLGINKKDYFKEINLIEGKNSISDFIKTYQFLLDLPKNEQYNYLNKSMKTQFFNQKNNDNSVIVGAQDVKGHHNQITNHSNGMSREEICKTMEQMSLDYLQSTEKQIAICNEKQKNIEHLMRENEKLTTELIKRQERIDYLTDKLINK